MAHLCLNTLHLKMVLCRFQAFNLALQTHDLHLFVFLPLRHIFVVDRVSDGFCVFSFGCGFQFPHPPRIIVDLLVQLLHLLAILGSLGDLRFRLLLFQKTLH